MNKYSICIGDKTTHGGVALSGSFPIKIQGKPIACLGDMVFCSLCKGGYPVEGSSISKYAGRKIALENMVTACGAKLIASQKKFF